MTGPEPMTSSSGDMYATVPTVLPVCVIASDPVSFARPKSRTLATPPAVTIQVGRFDIAVNDAGSMCLTQANGNLVSDTYRFIER